MADNGESSRGQSQPSPRRRGTAALEAQRRAVQAKARRRIAVAVTTAVVVVIVVVVLAVVLTGKGKPKDATAGTSAAPGTAICTYIPAGSAAKDVGRPPTTGFVAGAYRATVATNQGVITIDLDGTKAPCTVNSFTYLASKGYFDSTNCHRLTTSGIFVLQCGDPTATGRGGPGYRFGDENLAGATYPAGTVAMANAGPGTNGSQFFLVYKDTQLPPNYTPFGTVTAGLDVLNAIAAKGTDNSNGPGDGKPNVPVSVTKVTVTRVS